jgi:hypothetical protein
MQIRSHRYDTSLPHQGRQRDYSKAGQIATVASTSASRSGQAHAARRTVSTLPWDTADRSKLVAGRESGLALGWRLGGAYAEPEHEGSKNAKDEASDVDRDERARQEHRVPLAQDDRAFTS